MDKEKQVINAMQKGYNEAHEITINYLIADIETALEKLTAGDTESARGVLETILEALREA